MLRKRGNDGTTANIRVLTEWNDKVWHTNKKNISKVAYFKKKQYLCSRVWRKVVWVVERAALEMRCTHCVVPGVRIPHFPQKKKRVLLHKERSFSFWKGRAFSNHGRGLLSRRKPRTIRANYSANKSLTFRKKRKEYSSTRSALFFLKRQGLL